MISNPVESDLYKLSLRAFAVRRCERSAAGSKQSQYPVIASLHFVAFAMTYNSDATGFDMNDNVG